jgi:hypothetical protein
MKLSCFVPLQEGKAKSVEFIKDWLILDLIQLNLQLFPFQNRRMQVIRLVQSFSGMQHAFLYATVQGRFVPWVEYL